MRQIGHCLLIALVGMSLSVRAQVNSSRSGSTSTAPVRAAADALAIPAGTAIQIDGVFSEEVWSRAPAIDNFIVRTPTEGATPTHRTEAHVLFDQSAIY